MNTKQIKKIVFIGAGNLATHLSKALMEAGFPVMQVYSRTQQSAYTLGRRLGVSYTSNLKDVDRDADIYFFALKDSVLESVLRQLKLEKGVFVHTAGSLPMDFFSPFAYNYGVFYPLQTFSRDRDVDFSNIPVCVEANNDNVQKLLLTMGHSISQNVSVVDSQQRQKLHLSAVFVCNFTNHMYSIGHDLLKDSSLDFDLLRPLIQETAAKVQYMDPKEAQTGPAIRFDEPTIKNHEQKLNCSPILQKLYRFVSESIHHMHAKGPNHDDNGSI